MDRDFDPRRLPDGGRSLTPALDLCTALALLDDDHPSAWQRCRSAALRYAEAVRAGRFPLPVALDLLRRAAETWTPRELPAGRRARLDARIPFWVGTVYGARWRPGTYAAEPSPTALSPDDPATAPAAAPAVAPLAAWTPAPPPGCWTAMRAWRAAVDAQRAEFRARRAALQSATAALEARSASLWERAADHLANSQRLQKVARERLADAASASAAVATRERPATRRLTDAQIESIARRIRRAVREPHPDDPRDDILGPRYELSAEDEARVEAKLRALHDADA